ncbi:MAG: 2Fe-2S iron-sulfur cluster-binding protein, partial [bacterium]
RGESIAAALFKAGVRTLSYSVKYKRPRGIHCARGRCVMCHMSVNGVPGVPTCITPLEEGMRVEREEYRPFFAPLLISAARLFPFKAGFYNRFFNRPQWVRNFFVQSLRKMAGVGRIRADRPAPTPRPSGPAPVAGRYDVVVVGAGLSGMSAALSAAESFGAAGTNARDHRVLLVDEYGVPGGHSIGFQPDSIRAERERLSAAVRKHPSITHQPNTTAVGFFPPDTLLIGPGGCTGFDPSPGPDAGSDRSGAGTGGGMTRVRARAFVFATGAYDVTPLFRNNDTPGIFGPRAIRLLLERDGLRPGAAAVVYGTGDTLRRTVELLAHHGIQLVHLVDPAAAGPTGPPDAAPTNTTGPPVARGARVTSARGKEWITGVIITGGGTSKKTLRCDLLCTAFTGQGAYELPYQAGIEYHLSGAEADENRVLVPRTALLDTGEVTIVLAGETAGHTVDPAGKIADGAEAGKQAAAAAGA